MYKRQFLRSDVSRETTGYFDSFKMYRFYMFRVKQLVVHICSTWNKSRCFGRVLGCFYGDFGLFLIVFIVLFRDFPFFLRVNLRARFCG